MQYTKMKSFNKKVLPEAALNYDVKFSLKLPSPVLTGSGSKGIISAKGTPAFVLLYLFLIVLYFK